MVIWEFLFIKYYEDLKFWFLKIGIFFEISYLYDYKMYLFYV